MKDWIAAALLPAALMILIAGCAGTSQKMNLVKIGMTEPQVVAAIGVPDSTSATFDTVYLRYRLNSGWLFTDDYYVRLREGIVDAYGRAGDFGLGY